MIQKRKIFLIQKIIKLEVQLKKLKNEKNEIDKEINFIDKQIKYFKYKKSFKY